MSVYIYLNNLSTVYCHGDLKNARFLAKLCFGEKNTICYIKIENFILLMK